MFIPLQSVHVLISSLSGSMRACRGSLTAAPPTDDVALGRSQYALISASNRAMDGIERAAIAAERYDPAVVAGRPWPA
jgi:hypothetical protein